MNININITTAIDEEQINFIIRVIEKESKRIMSALTELQAKFDAAVAAAKQAFTDGASAISALQAQVAALAAQIAAGGTVDPNELAQVEADLGTQADALTAAASAFEGSLPASTTTPASAPANAPASTPAPTPQVKSPF